MKKKDIEIVKLKITEADAEARVAIVMKEECDKEIERDKKNRPLKH